MGLTSLKCNVLSSRWGFVVLGPPECRGLRPGLRIFCPFGAKNKKWRISREAATETNALLAAILLDYLTYFCFNITPECVIHD